MLISPFNPLNSLIGNIRDMAEKFRRNKAEEYLERYDNPFDTPWLHLVVKLDNEDNLLLFLVETQKYHDFLHEAPGKQPVINFEGIKLPRK